MGYRDDLGAALQRNVELEHRIAQLEKQLEDGKRGKARAPSPTEPYVAMPNLRDRLKKLEESEKKLVAAESRILELEEEVSRHLGVKVAEDRAELRLQLELARSALDLANGQRDQDRAAAARLASLPTVVQRWRGEAALEGGQPTGFVCPLCHALGDPVEMRYTSGAPRAVCPRCRYEHPG